MADEPEETGLRPRIQRAFRSLLGVTEMSGIEEKDIWGPTWRTFMGIDGDSSGVREVTDQPADQLIARTSESYIYRCVDVRGKAISQVPLRVWQEDRITGKRKAVDHPALDVLRKTNELGWVDGLSTLLRYTLGSLDLSGRCTWQLAFDRKGLPSEVFWTVPTSITPLHGSDKRRPDIPFWGIRINAGINARDIPAEKVVYFATDNPADPIMGTSKIQVLRNAINLRAYSQRSNMDFFKNSMRPDWLLHGAFRNTEENVERIRRAIRRHLSGESNRMPLILGEGMTAQLLTTSHNDAEWLGQQRLSQEEISATFGVPVIYMNNLERATFDNISTAKLILWHDTMIPEGDALAETLTRRFLWRFWPDAVDDNLSFAFDYNAIEGLGEDVARIWERFKDFRTTLTAEVSAREVTPNQARAQLAQLASELGFDPTPYEGEVPGGEQFFVPFQHIPVEQAGVQAVIDVYAARGPNPQLEENIPGAEHAEDERGPEPRAPTPPPASTQQPASRGPQNRNDFDPEALRKDLLEDLKTLIPRNEPAEEKAPPTPDPVPIRDARLNPVIDNLERRLKRYFQNLQTESLQTFRGKKSAEDQGEVDPEAPLYDHAKAQSALAEIIRAGISDAGMAAYFATSADFKVGVTWEDPAWVDDYLSKRMAMIKGIDETTRDALREALREGLAAKEDASALSQRITKVFRDGIDWRARRIARTEAMQAYAAASLKAYQDAGITEVRMYDGPFDDSANCDSVDGMVVSIAEAIQLMALEHPNGTRAVAPIVNLHRHSRPTPMVIG